MLDALRQIDGVDEKFLRRPEVGMLSSELEDGELPGAVVTNGSLSIAVATDRKILNIRKSIWGNTISKVDSYPYAEIESITAGKGIFDNPLTVIIGGKKHRIEADKGRRHTFAEYVSARLPALAAAKWEQEDKLPSHTSGKTELPQGTGRFDLNVVGESNYQDAIVRAERMADTDGRSNRFVKVTLQRESANPFDSNAVCVLSPAGQVMGYLGRADAKAYAPGLDALGAAGYYVTCSASMGRGEHGYGVQLDLKTPEAVQVPEQGKLEPVEDNKYARSFHSDVYSKRVGNPDGPLFGEVVVFTGDMRMPRGELAAISSAAGCRLDENVTKRTTILVLGVRDSAYEGNGTKHDKALDYSKRFRPIEIINAEVFLSRLRDAGVQFDIEQMADAKREYQKERTEEKPASKSEYRW